MEKQSEVKLLGAWSCDYSTRVKLALKLKGISFEYVEEDLADKTQSLLQDNPVSKKVPVLIHNGKTIAESQIIIEYIDDCWYHTPKFFPEDPYQRAIVRFWANYYDQQVKPVTYKIMASKGKEREKAIEEFNQGLQAFEHGIEKDFPTKSPFTNGDSLGYLDIVVGSSACNYRAFNETFGVIFDPEKNPSFMTWVMAMKKWPMMKETLPPHDCLVAEMIKVLEHQPKTKYCGKNYVISTFNCVIKMCLELVLMEFCTSC